LASLPPPPPLLPTGQLKEKICAMRPIVHKVAVDEMVVRSFIEKEKTGFYAKLGVFKPKPEEIVCESITQYYEQHVAARANYTIDYYRKKIYPIRVDAAVKEVTIFDKTLQPGGQEKSGKQISIEAKERIALSTPAYVFLDKNGKEVDPKKLPAGVEEPNSESVFGSLGGKIRGPSPTVEAVVGMVRSRIVKRPQDIERIVDEVFEVTELSAIYTPIYEAHLKQLKTGVIKVVQISAVTGKVYNL